MSESRDYKQLLGQPTPERDVTHANNGRAKCRGGGIFGKARTKVRDSCKFKISRFHVDRRKV